MIKIFSSLFLSAIVLMPSSTLAADKNPVTIPLLVYHHIRSTKAFPPSTWSYKMSVSPLIFEKQMQWVADHGYTTIDLDTATKILKGEASTITKPIVITFDDNQKSAYDLAVPILEKNKQSAVFYIITNRLGNKQYIDNDRVRDLVARGMDIESHTVTHATLTNLSQKKLDEELRESKRVLEELTGKPVLHIAYPSTAQNKLVRSRAAALGYVTGTIMDPRRATQKDDLLRLPRIMMTDVTALAKVLP